MVRRVPFLPPRSTLHLAYSLSCNLACSHCIFRCGPAGGPAMGLPRARAFLGQAGRAGVRRVVFTGGEPFLYPEALRQLVRYATQEGMQSGLLTNGAWATSRRETRRLLLDLRARGLASLTVSTDRYHLLEVPVANLRRLLDTAAEIGLRGGVKVSRLPHDPVAEGLVRTLRPHAHRLVVQEIAPLGRAAHLRARVRLHPSTRFAGPGCATPPLLLPDGSLLTCCNLPARDVQGSAHPFVLGNLDREPLASLLDRRTRDPLLAVLRAEGPQALLSRGEGDTSSRPEGPAGGLYHSRCDLCFHLFCKPPNKGRWYALLGKGAPRGRVPRTGVFA